MHLVLYGDAYHSQLQFISYNGFNFGFLTSISSACQRAMVCSQTLLIPAFNFFEFLDNHLGRRICFRFFCLNSFLPYFGSRRRRVSLIVAKQPDISLPLHFFAVIDCVLVNHLLPPASFLGMHLITFIFINKGGILSTIDIAQLLQLIQISIDSIGLNFPHKFHLQLL